MRQVLNVAEKPSVAKEVARVLSGGTSRTMESESKYNPVYQFDFKLEQEPVSMLFTSVTGHVFQTKFEDRFKNWSSFNPSVLLEPTASSIIRYIDPEKKGLERNLLKWARTADVLILWLDCDREGEAIAYEVIEICSKVNKHMMIKRAWFSSLDRMNVTHAINNLREPRQELAEAVNARIEIDLRIGAAFTVFQTLNLQNSFASLKEKKEPISYGPCQFPTLGFVVDRFNQIQKFTEERFWYIQPTYTWKEGTKTISVDLKWSRGRVYDQMTASALYMMCVEDDKKEYNPKGVVIHKQERDTSKQRPTPLTTVDLTKQGCRVLQMGSERIMHVAEQLYQNGYISYPRTETSKYPDSMNNAQLQNFVRNHRQSSDWGFYAEDLLDRNKFQRPRAGRSDDQAHPPIHPIKLADKNSLKPEEWKVYEFITRHFLATCGRDALGSKTEITVKFNDETFLVEGLVIKEKNYLEVWKYERWSESQVPDFDQGTVIVPQLMQLSEGKTTAPKLLSESELIHSMNKNGIGTDATMHDHITTIQKRNYATKLKGFFTPTSLGIALCNTYSSIGLTLSKPNLRAKMERLMSSIAIGETSSESAKENILNEMREIFLNVETNQKEFVEHMSYFLKESAVKPSPQNQQSLPAIASPEIQLICGNCDRPMELQTGLSQRLLFCGTCVATHQLPKNGTLTPRDERCPLCRFQVVDVKTESGSTYSVCSSCFSDPPPESQFALYSENTPQGMSMFTKPTMACFKCMNKACKLSGAVKTTPIFTCPCCTSNILIKDSKYDKKSFIACSNYPACNWSVFLPRDVTQVVIRSQTTCCDKHCTPGVSQISLSESECKKCEKEERKSRLVKFVAERQGQFETILGEDVLVTCFYPGCNGLLSQAGVRFKDIKKVHVKVASDPSALVHSGTGSSKAPPIPAFDGKQHVYVSSGNGFSLEESLNGKTKMTVSQKLLLVRQKMQGSPSLDHHARIKSALPVRTTEFSEFFPSQSKPVQQQKSTTSNFMSQAEARKLKQQPQGEIKSDLLCFKCKEPGHLSFACTKSSIDGSQKKTQHTASGRQESSKSEVEATTFAKELYSQYTCYQCGEKGHIKRKCPHPPPEILEKPPASSKSKANVKEEEDMHKIVEEDTENYAQEGKRVGIEEEMVLEKDKKDKKSATKKKGNGKGKGQGKGKVKEEETKAEEEGAVYYSEGDEKIPKQKKAISKQSLSNRDEQNVSTPVTTTTRRRRNPVQKLDANTAVAITATTTEDNMKEESKLKPKRQKIQKKLMQQDKDEHEMKGGEEKRAGMREEEEQEEDEWDPTANKQKKSQIKKDLGKLKQNKKKKEEEEEEEEGEEDEREGKVQKIEGKAKEKEEAQTEAKMIAEKEGEQGKAKGKGIRKRSNQKRELKTEAEGQEEEEEEAIEEKECELCGFATHLSTSFCPNKKKQQQKKKKK